MVGNLPFVRQTFILLTLVAIGALGASESFAAERPNIVFILADDVGQEPIGCYGGTSYHTPHLDELARTGMRFTHAYSMPVCHPTRICLLTGRYPFRLDHPGWGTFPKTAERQTVAHVMKGAGYATAVAGKWQLTLLKRDPEHPRRMGFDESCLFGWHEGPRYYDPLIWQNGRIRDDTQGRYGPDLYCDFLIDFMARSKESHRPFFAFYSMALCHNVTDDLDHPVPFGPEGHYDTYQQMIEAMDARVGRIVSALDRLGLRENTVVVFTGDNGSPKSYIHTAVDGKLVNKPIAMEFRGERVRGGKGELTDAGTRVPLIANWPGTISPGQVVDDLVDFSDFLPTFAELGGALRSRPGTQGGGGNVSPAFATLDGTPLLEGVQIDGHSFAGRLCGQPFTPRTWAFAEHRGKQWVRTHRWKLYDDGRLFDLRADPREQSPVPNDNQPPAAASARQTLQAAFAKLHKTTDTQKSP